MERNRELVYLSASAARRLFVARQLSPVELVAAVIARAERTEPVVDAFAERLFDEALVQASEAERRVLGKGGREPRPRRHSPIPAGARVN